MPLEATATRPAGPISILRDMSAATFANGFVGFVFAASGPLAIILAIGSRGGLSAAQLSSWIFGAFALNGVLSVLFSAFYRQPLAFFWTIPGTVLLGPALGHLTFPEVVGAFIVTGVLMLVLGLSGLVRRAMDAVPMPIVMGMVAGVFLQFGLDWVRAFETDIRIALPMTAVFLLLSALPRAGRMMPPLIGALLTGLAVMLMTGSFVPPPLGWDEALVSPLLVRPAWSLPAMAELVLPLAVTVLAAQNAQGIAIVMHAGHRPPVNAITAACGLGSVVTAFVGAVPTCLTGPTNAILTSSGAREHQYTGGVVVGLFAIAFGLLAPLVTRIMLAMPTAFIATLAGLAMLRVLLSAFTVAFKGSFGLGALVTFLVTVAGLPVFNIGAPFWGLLFGYLVSRLAERQDFADAVPSRPVPAARKTAKRTSRGGAGRRDGLHPQRREVQARGQAMPADTNSKLAIGVIPVTPFQQNCAIIWDEATKIGAVVDPGGRAAEIADAIAKEGIRIEKILLTHGHIDHAAGAAEMKALLGGVPIEGPHIADKFLMDNLEAQGAAMGIPGRNVSSDLWLEDGATVSVGAHIFEVRHCPGHSPGSVVFICHAQRFILMGDVLFRGSIGRTDFPYGDHAALIDAIKTKLMVLDDDYQFLCGHGPMSTIGDERGSNPFLV